jgi:NarL family two-component system response regulator LiaR
MDGIEAIRRITARRPEARILVLTSFAADEKVFPAIKAGALGYLLKDSGPAELVSAIHQVHRGEPSLHPTIARKLLDELSRPSDRPPTSQSALEGPPSASYASASRSEGELPVPAATGQTGTSETAHRVEPLTQREVQVLRLVARGWSNQEIADHLVISEATVRTHVSNILGKLHLVSRTQAALYALREGLASLDDADENM